MKKFLISFLIVNFLVMPVLALEFDTSLDDKARRNYTPDKIEDNMALPALPKILDLTDEPVLKNTKPVSNKNSVKSIGIEKNFSLKPEQNYAVLRKGTKVRLKLLNNISDLTQKGTKITFVSTYPVTTTYFTIPMGTIFKGEIMNSHGPQFSGNGGLIVVKITSMVLNGEIQPVNASVVKADSKMIFLNNIKGKRKYLTSMVKSTKPGLQFFRKMLKVTGNLVNDGSSIILTPFSLAVGVLAAGGNIIVSPALAMFYKGSPIFINSGSEFEVKLLQDTFIYK
ncbi:MAG: hypothetical protein PHC64_01945 [Candidatus Gastranaerophilales bacterium]|nr:hypothetical protein [Candidatus Gastranaerophilales bacterium]